MNNDDELTAKTGAALLVAFGKALNRLSMLSVLAALLTLGLTRTGFYSAIFLAVSVIAALLQGYFAARCAFDAAVFAALGGETGHYESFDNILARWRLRTQNKALRSLDERVQGAMRLLRWQAMSFVVQIVSLAAGLVVV